jgi:hypothetical protein
LSQCGSMLSAEKSENSSIEKFPVPAPKSTITGSQRPLDTLLLHHMKDILISRIILCH